MTAATRTSSWRGNEPTLELRRPAERARLAAALAELDKRLPLGAGELESVDPSSRGVVARASQSTSVQISAAFEAAATAFGPWARMPVADRAAVLVRAAAELRARRYELAALEVRECAKPWVEADADVCEAIDFCEYYAWSVLGGPPELVQVRGEMNSWHFRPRGVCAVIAPWNFPIAIATGMCAAALVTGNCVLFKPAEQAPACGQAVFDAFVAGGVPDGVLSLLTGDGAVGAALVERADTVAFTGSLAVGQEIAARAGLSRLVLELGGKNCVIVDADADLDVVVPAVLDSAFGFAGQKCSAASRVLVHERVYEALAARLRGALETLAVGPAADFGVDVPAVIEAAAVERIEAMIAGGSVLRGDAGPGGGFYVAPALVFEPSSELAANEVFGPVLSVEPVSSVAAACDVVDSLGQALTGGLFSRNPRVVAEVAARTPVGNLYVNRGITGAMVGRQPFGGNRLSGTGAKAGGPTYLAHFMDPVVVCEDTTRHGIET
ncbi:MAG: aldehyde dehydrogenase family protein [Solirubrobacterales bacterium]|nr:aldehyde dehydrogenase family protein [Solirubrobacterales bacterium]